MIKCNLPNQLPPALGGKWKICLNWLKPKTIQESFRLKPIPFSPIREWAPALRDKLRPILLIQVYFYQYSILLNQESFKKNQSFLFYNSIILKNLSFH